MFIVIVGLCVGAFYLVKLFVDEIRSMPLDDPSTELNVDELRIHKVEEQDALLVIKWQVNILMKILEKEFTTLLVMNTLSLNHI